LRTFQTGQHVRQAQNLLNEIAQARVCLLNPVRKAEYDAALRTQLQAQRPPAAAAPQAVPAAIPTAVEADFSPQPVFVDPTASASRIPRRTRAPLWRQPAALLVAASVLLLLGVLGIWFTRGDKPEPIAAAPSPSPIERPPLQPGPISSPSEEPPPPPAGHTTAAQAPDPPATSAPTTVAAGVPAGAQPEGASAELTLVCESLNGDSQFTGLAGGASFLRDKPEGYIGERGIAIQSPADWQQRGTQWRLEHQRYMPSSGALHLVHPWRNGQLIIKVGLQLWVKGGQRWGGWRDPTHPTSGQGVALRLTPAASNAIPTKVGQLYQVVSRLGADGKYGLYLDGVLVVEGQAPDEAEPLEFKTASTTTGDETGRETRVFKPGEAGVFLADNSSQAQMRQVRFGPAHAAIAAPSATVATSSGAPLTPPAASTALQGVRIDLLKQIDLPKHSVRGTPSLAGTSLTGAPNGGQVVVQLPYRPGDREYALEIVAELTDGGGPLNVGLVSAPASFLVSLDYGGKTGLSKVNGNQHLYGSAPSGSIFANGAKPNVRIFVRQQGVHVLANGRVLLSWQDYRRLTPNESWIGPDPQALTIGWNLGTFRIDKLEVIELSGRFPASSASPPTTTQPPAPPPGTSAPPPVAARRPTPPGEELQAAEEQIRKVFAQEFEKAPKADVKAELAKTLAGQAAETVAKPAEHYMMLKLSIGLAAEAGEVDAALGTLDTLAASYEIDLAELATPMVSKLAGTAKTAEARTRLVEAALEYSGTCLADDDFEAATQLASLAMQTASKLRETELRKTVKEHQDEVKLLEKQWQAAQAAAETLKDNPDDPAANLARGKYLCLVKQEWEQGLPLLVKSGDAALKSAAELELAAEKKPEDKSALGDAWMAAAKGAAAAERAALEERAEHWYEDALDELTGLAKTQVERRLSELRSSDAAKPLRTARAKKDQGPTPGMAGRIILDNGDAGLNVFYQPATELRDETLKAALATHNIKWRPLQIDLGGYFTVPVSGSVYFHQRCQGPVDAGARLFVDGKELFTVGPASPSSTHIRTIGAGGHTLRWVIAGRESIGSCELRVYYINPATNTSDNLPIFYLPQNLPTSRLRTKGEANLSSN
jgi:hypothetical protein